MRPSSSLESKIPSDILKSSVYEELVYMKVQARFPLKQSLEVMVGYDLLNQLGSYRNTMKFQVSSRKEKRFCFSRRD